MVRCDSSCCSLHPKLLLRRDVRGLLTDLHEEVRRCTAVRLRSPIILQQDLDTLSRLSESIRFELAERLGEPTGVLARMPMLEAGRIPSGMRLDRREYNPHPSDSLHAAAVGCGIAVIQDSTASRREQLEGLLGRYEFSIPEMESYCEAN